MCDILGDITRLYFTEGVFRCGHTRLTRSMTIVNTKNTTSFHYQRLALQRKAGVYFGSWYR